MEIISERDEGPWKTEIQLLNDSSTNSLTPGQQLEKHLGLMGRNSIETDIPVSAGGARSLGTLFGDSNAGRHHCFFVSFLLLFFHLSGPVQGGTKFVTLP